jgi:hypothetical protein
VKLGHHALLVDLDAGRPLVTPRAGQRDFPYEVSKTDPEVYYVTANTESHDVSWYLELDWSSGGQHGTVRIDDNGQPFRTNAELRLSSTESSTEFVRTGLPRGDNTRLPRRDDPARASSPDSSARSRTAGCR